MRIGIHPWRFVHKPPVDSPVWRLTQALASLTTPDGNSIVVPGYYDAIRPPNDEEQRLAAGMLAEWRAREPLQRQTLGVARWIDGLEGDASLMRGYFGTTLNINGIWSGYTGPGSSSRDRVPVSPISPGSKSSTWTCSTRLPRPSQQLDACPDTMARPGACCRFSGPAAGRTLTAARRVQSRADASEPSRANAVIVSSR
jgi:hypothetical protein